MRLRTEIGASIGALLTVQVVTSFGAVVLLSRMTPAVRQILDENVVSVHAAEEMLAAVALAPQDHDGQVERFTLAYESARSNVTEAAEAPLLDAIEVDAAAALAGEPGAVRRVVDALGELASVNQDSMGEADADAQRLGAAGAWSALLLGLVGFLSGVGVSRLLVQRVERPIEEIRAVLAAWRAGDVYRRCTVGDCPEDLATIARQLDQLRDRGARVAPGELDLDRVALLAVIDQVTVPLAVLDPTGALVATNQAADDALTPAVRAALADPAQPAPPGWTREALRDGVGWVCSS